MMTGFVWVVLLGGSASAASRVVVSTPEPMQVYFDGMIQPTSVGTIRTAITSVTPGTHELAFHSLTGAKLYSEKLIIPDNADVRVTYTPGAPLSVTGAEAGAPHGTAAPFNSAQTSNAAGMGGVSSVGPRQSVSSTPSGPTTGNVLEGSATSTTRASGLKRSINSPTPANLVSGAGRGLATMTAGAHAGNNFGRETPAQQVIKKPNVVYGRTIFKKSGGGPLVIYENGQLVAQFGAGQAEAVVDLEVGRRELEVRSGVDYRVLFQGDLQVDQSHVESVNISDSSPPRATIRPWLWKDL